MCWSSRNSLIATALGSHLWSRVLPSRSLTRGSEYSSFPILHIRMPRSCETQKIKCNISRSCGNVEPFDEFRVSTTTPLARLLSGSKRGLQAKMAVVSFGDSAVRTVRALKHMRGSSSVVFHRVQPSPERVIILSFQLSLQPGHGRSSASMITRNF